MEHVSASRLRTLSIRQFVLAALDDNQDGFLRDQELLGIRAWFDANSDGQSNSSEVIDLEQLGVIALDVRTSAYDGIHPTNPKGVILESGQTLPTWDWIAEPIPPHQQTH